MARILYGAAKAPAAPAGLRDLGEVPPLDADYTGEERNEMLQATWREFQTPDSLLAWRPAKDVAIRHGSSFYVTNSQGFLSSGELRFFYAPSKPADVFRVVVLGGSAVAGQGVRSPSENLAAQLRLAVRPPRGRRLEVINAGVHAYHSGQELLYLESELTRYRPDLVIAFDGWNDLWADVNGMARASEEWSPLKSSVHYDNDEALLMSGSVEGASRALVSAVYLRVKRFLWRGLASTHLMMLSADRIRGFFSKSRKSPAKPADSVSRAVAAYRENHRQMAALAGVEGFKFAWFLQPAMGVDDKTLSEEERGVFSPDGLGALREFYDGARAALAAEQADAARPRVCVADLSRSFSRERETIYVDNVHVSYVGNRILARRMAEELRRCRLP